MGFPLQSLAQPERRPLNIIVFSPAEWGRPLAADDERTIHIREVLRLVPGDRVRVGLLDVGVGQAIYRGPQELEFPPESALVAAEPALPLTVLLGQPRPPVMQRLLKDLGALGVARILVVASELSEKSYMQSRLWQGHAAAGETVAAGDGPWRRQLIAGAQQGGHCFLAKVDRFYSVKKAIESLTPADPAAAGRLVLDLVPSALDLLNFCAGLRAGVPSSGVPEAAPASWCLAIGPERGWSERERALFTEHGFAAFGLGRRILRTETATILATGMMSLALQDAP